MAAPAPVDGDTVPVDPGPEVAVPGEAAGGEDEVAPAGLNAVEAVSSAAAVRRANFVMSGSLAIDFGQRAIGRPSRRDRCSKTA